jgi:hypothetical protein
VTTRSVSGWEQVFHPKATSSILQWAQDTQDGGGGGGGRWFPLVSALDGGGNELDAVELGPAIFVLSIKSNHPTHSKVSIA